MWGRKGHLYLVNSWRIRFSRITQARNSVRIAVSIIVQCGMVGLLFEAGEQQKLGRILSPLAKVHARPRIERYIAGTRIIEPISSIQMRHIYVHETHIAMASIRLDYVQNEEHVEHKNSGERYEADKRAVNEHVVYVNEVHVATELGQILEHVFGAENVDDVIATLEKLGYRVEGS